MRRFTFTTTAVPKFDGEGVVFDDGRAAYRIRENGAAWTSAYSGAVADIEYQFGGLPGFDLDYID